MQEARVLSVSALTRAVKGALEGTFPFVWVRGQVTNLSRPSSGHVYFSLCDEGASLAAVWFKGAQRAGERFDPLTGEVFEDGHKPSLATSLKNGLEIVCAGRLSVYAARGVYQLVVELAQEAGLGRLHEEFERLKKELAAKGYFALERKRPLPGRPTRLALVTAPTGAAVHDFLRVAAGRGYGSEIRLHPVLVQGAAAPGQIAGAVQKINAEAWAEVIVLIRGGGSLEDLWAFNSPEAAQAVFSSQIPVLAGIGHEVDVSLVDMTADARAATPSHAAQLLWPERAELRRSLATLARALERGKAVRLERDEACLDSLRRLLQREGGRTIAQKGEALNLFDRALAWHTPQRRLAGQEERLALTLDRLQAAVPRSLEAKESVLRVLRLGLERVPGLPERLGRNLGFLEDRLFRGGRALFVRAGQGLDLATVRLQGLNPLAPLERGYALARKTDGSYVRSPAQTVPGEPLTITVRDGDIPVRVEGGN